MAKKKSKKEITILERIKDYWEYHQANDRHYSQAGFFETLHGYVKGLEEENARLKRGEFGMLLEMVDGFEDLEPEDRPKNGNWYTVNIGSKKDIQLIFHEADYNSMIKEAEGEGNG